MECIIALNVDSLVAAVVGRLVQPRVPGCINGFKNTFAKNAKTSTQVGIKIHRNAKSAKHINPLKTLIGEVTGNDMQDVVRVSTRLVLFA